LPKLSLFGEQKDNIIISLQNSFDRYMILI